MLFLPRIVVIAGCMSSGKSSAVIAALEPLRYSNRPLQVFRPAIDTEPGVHSRPGRKLDATTVETSAQLLELVEERTRVVGIDEAQFFDIHLADVAVELVRRGRQVIVAGLDLDWEGNVFPSMQKLFGVAEQIEKRHGWCTWVEGDVQCGEPATRSQRIVATTAQFDAGQDKYVARCLAHWDPKKFV